MITAEIPFKAFISFDQNRVGFMGPAVFKKKIDEKIKLFGLNPKNWNVAKAQDGYDVLLNEFVLKCQDNYKIPYIHDELCHCRMVQTQKVLSVIKQDAFSVTEIGRVTMAGTGCGSCKKDIEELVNYLVK